MGVAGNSAVGITGMGVVSPAGIDADSLYDALVAGGDCIADLEQPWASPPYNMAAAVGDFGAAGYIPPRRLRRMNRLSQMAVVAALQARNHAGLGEGSETGIVLGTGLGALSETVAFMQQLLEDPAEASPALFPSSVMNVAAAHVSMELGLHGYSTTVNHKETSGELALVVATDLIRLGHARILLVGGVDELNAPAHHGYRRFGALARGKPYPYRAQREGLALGEGACVLAVENVEQARQRGAHILAEIAGTGAAGGCRPLVGWGPSLDSGRQRGPAVEAGVIAIRQALADAGMKPDEVDLVIGSGCGSKDLDRLEAAVLGEVFGSRPVALTSPHGAVGTWMAGGALRVATGVSALCRGVVYPTVTSGEVDPDVPVHGLVTTPRQFEIRAVLICGLATGGGSAAIILRTELV